MASEQKTLQEAVVYFNDPDYCIMYLVARRWPNGVTCPTCGSTKVSYLKSVRRWQCSSHQNKRQFTLKTGTIMEDSPLGIDKWMVATWLVLNCKNGISSYEIARALGISQKSAWHLMHRVRFTIHGGSTEKPSGHVEVDETFIGGKARNMHVEKRARRITSTGGKDKTAVMGILERGGKVRTTVVPNRKKHALQSEVKKHVEAGSALYSDALQSYNGLAGEYAHQVIDHTEKYVDGVVHTNSLEFSGVCLNDRLVEPFHLFRYLDEQAYRFNNLKLTDGERFDTAVRGITGKRLTFNQLIGR